MKRNTVPATIFFILYGFGILKCGWSETVSDLLPASVYNHKTPYFPAIIRQQGESCASANAVGYIFTYEINAARNISAQDPENQYPYFGTYNFLNDGSDEIGTYRMFIDAWEIIRDNGIHNAIDFGEPDPYATKWVSGYEKYYRAMHNRVADIDSLSFLGPGALYSMKKWLYNHSGASPCGGIFTVTVCAYGVQEEKISKGRQIGKWIIRKFGTSISLGPHALAVVGYDDSIQYDYNRDGKVTNNIDINGDGKIDHKDSETGAFILANTWGETSGDSGFTYAPYRIFFLPIDSGGLISDKAYYITVRKDYTPLQTFRLSIEHKHRNMIAVSVGISDDTSAIFPKHIRSIKQFSYAGGYLPMCGVDASPLIEIGLDVSDLADSIPEDLCAAYFLIVDARETGGECISLSMLDYSENPPKETVCDDAPRSFVKGRNIFKIIAPPMGINTERKNVFKSHNLQFFIGDDIRMIAIPGNVVKIEIFDIMGKRIRSESIKYDKKLFTIPFPSPVGMFLIKTTGKEGSERNGVIGVFR